MEPSGVNGDPHFKTWSGEKYDFHGICDLVLLKNPYFAGGLGMDIYVRSKQTKQWSYISTAVIRIGRDTFEVSGHKDGDSFWINGVEGGDWKEGTNIAGYPIRYRRVNSQQREYEIDLSEGESILMRTWKDFVRVDVVGAKDTNFHSSLGLMGSYPKGNALGRDGKTVMKDWNSFGQDWQVLSSDPKLFHNNDNPQHPIRCRLPGKSVLRRRLSKSTFSRKDAELACSRVSPTERDLCLFDVMATNDPSAALAHY